MPQSGLQMTVAATADPASGTAPLDVVFTARATGGIPPYRFVWQFGLNDIELGERVVKRFDPPTNQGITASVIATDSSQPPLAASASTSVFASRSLPIVWAHILVDAAGDKGLSKNEGRYSQKWQVLVSSKFPSLEDGLVVEAEVTPWDVLASGRIPPLGDPYRRWIYSPLDDTYSPGEILDESFSVVYREARRAFGHPGLWEVEIAYEGIGQPTAEPTDVSFSESPYQDYVTQDVYGRPIANSAFDPYEGGVPVDRTRTVLTISKNVPYDKFDPVAAAAYKNTLNATPYRLGSLKNRFGNPLEFAPGMLRLTSLTADRIERQKRPYPDPLAMSGEKRYFWRVQARIDIDESEFSSKGGSVERSLWRRVLLDAGFQKIANGIKRAIVLPGGQRPSSPQMLDGAGGVLPTRTSYDLPQPIPLLVTLYPIVPQNEYYAIAAGSTLTVSAPGVLANDYGAVSCAIKAAPSPSDGTLSLNSNGSFTFVPAVGFTGWTKFSYYANAPGQPQFAEANVAIFVGVPPVFLPFDVYRRTDWSELWHILGDW